MAHRPPCYTGPAPGADPSSRRPRGHRRDGYVEQWRAQWSRSGIERPELSIRRLVTGQEGEPIGPFVLTDTRGLPGTDRLTLLTREEADVALTDAVRNAPELISWALARKVGVMIDGTYAPLATADPQLVLRLEAGGVPTRRRPAPPAARRASRRAPRFRTREGSGPPGAAAL